MRFDQQLIEGTLIRRYQRFLADVRLDDGTLATAHCPNSGSMKTCAVAGRRVCLSRHATPRRKLPLTLEMIHNGACWIGVNTMLPNRLAEEAVRAGRIPELGGYDEIRREVVCGPHTRLDLRLRKAARTCFVEVKNVTLVAVPGAPFEFPDSVTERGRKHLRALQRLRRRGDRAVMLFVIQRADGSFFQPAFDIDAKYAAALRRAYRAGVEILPYRFDVSPAGIDLVGRVPFRLTRRGEPTLTSTTTCRR